MNGADEWLVQRLTEAAELAGEALSAQQIGQLLRYCRMLQEWNEKMNLTAVVDDEGIAVKHILDSLTVLPVMDRLTLEKRHPLPCGLIDVGSGAGLPGLPLIIMRPQWRGVLLDALAKRVRFLDAVIAAIELVTTEAYHGRAEDAGRQPEMREQFDLAVARAVAPLSVLAEYCLPFVRVGGLFVAMKGHPQPEWPQAERAVGLLGGRLEDLHMFSLPGTDQQRSLFCIRKIREVAPAYPRKAGKPEKQPL